MTRARPRLAISLGDPAGIGPEVVLAALARGQVRADIEAVVVGDPRVVAEAARRLGLPVPAPPAASVRSAPGVEFDPARVFEGRPSAEGGRAAAAAIRGAVALVRRGEADALVTAPIHKEALGLAGEPYPGHTELLGAELDAPRVRMMLQGGPLRVVLVTTHVALADVPRRVTGPAVVETCEVAARGLELMGIVRPRLALAALNPHAGDGGRFGLEDRDVLAPAVAAARAKGLDVTGPHPADTLFALAVRAAADARVDARVDALTGARIDALTGARIDVVIACYHDQGLIPVKLAAFGKATNVTLGLPIVRTSPDHGTAFDIAGKGGADADSFVEALRVAADLVRRGARGL